jgi:hypothetical protein
LPVIIILDGSAIWGECKLRDAERGEYSLSELEVDPGVEMDRSDPDDGVGEVLRAYCDAMSV